MTDEELAEWWVTDNTGFNPKEPLGKIAIRTFLGGLKAGKDMAEADLAKAKELIEELSSSLSVVGECDEEECELLNRAEQFLREVGDDRKRSL